MNKSQLEFDQLMLDLKAVHIQCLDHDANPIKHKTGTGFILMESQQLFLYTCWHIVTGYNMHDIQLKHSLPIIGSLRITLQNCDRPGPDAEEICGYQSATLPLYDTQSSPYLPLWYQDSRDTPDLDLNEINIKVPFWHDLVKIPLPSDISVSELQIINSDHISINWPLIGEKVYIVGFPYGYSPLGMYQPTPIILTRFVASKRIAGRRTELLLDGPGSPGMSGGPVFIERDNTLLLSGLYTELIYPDYAVDQNEKTTALGTYCTLALWRQLSSFEKG